MRFTREQLDSMLSDAKRLASVYPLLGRDVACHVAALCCEVENLYSKMDAQMNQSDKSKVRRLTDEAWYAACDIQQSSAEGVHENIAKPISLLCNAVQNLCLALKEINEPEESP